MYISMTVQLACPNLLLGSAVFCKHVRNSFAPYIYHLQEKRALERKISEMEEELKV